MPKLLLTKRNIDSKKHIPQVEGSRRVDYFDTEVKGLVLKVGKESKVFYAQADVKDPATGKFKTSIEKIGIYGEVTPEEARTKAPEIIRRLREGRQKEEDIPKLKAIYERYLIDKRLAKSTEIVYRGYVPRLFESWLELPLNQIERALAPEIVIDRFRHVLDTAGPGAANNSFKCLQAIINYAELLYPQYISRNPIKVISRAEMWQKIGSREDSLEPAQFKLFADALTTATPSHRDCYLLALYHGLRPSEAYGLKWLDVDFNKGIITIRHTTETTKRSYTVPMSRQSKAILANRNESPGRDAEYVFPAQGMRNSHQHLIIRSDDLKRRTGLDLTVHGLRRSFISTGERLRLRREDINMLTGHTDHTVTGKHYAKVTPGDLRPVIQAIADTIELYLKESTSNVIQFPGMAKAA